MAVGTDSMLLGGWASTTNAKHILDIGTGTGLLALMLAQKNSHAKIDAIDNNPAATKLATQNFNRSAWADRFTVHTISLQDYAPAYVYDVIIANPPYYKDDLLGPEAVRNSARHQISLTYDDLLQGVYRLLAQRGEAFVAVPARYHDVFVSIAEEKELFITETMRVQARRHLLPYLIMYKLMKTQQANINSSIIIYNEQSVYTSDFIALTKSYYQFL